MHLSKESKILAGLCLADLISTVALIKGCGASEANTVLRFYLAYGLSAFVAAKCFLSIPALLIAEWYRPRNPLLVTSLLRLVIALYLGGYSASAYQVNCAPGVATLPTALQGERDPQVGTREARPVVISDRNHGWAPLRAGNLLRTAAKLTNSGE